jgi:hypothetical protein
MQLRLIVSSPSAGQNWDLRCLLREGLVNFLQREQPQALPRVRANFERRPPRPAGRAAAADAVDAVDAAAASDSADADNGAPALPASLPGGRSGEESGGHHINKHTGLAGLTAPTGGALPSPDAPPQTPR